jgi:cytoskeleton protein RodZ
MANRNPLPEIRGEVIKKARESKGISIHQISKELCFSVKQIEQIESGERSHFYSLAIKVAATKKVADYLGLSYDDVFDFGPDLVQESQLAEKNAEVVKDEISEEKPKEVPAVTPIVEKIPESIERFDLSNDEPKPKRSNTKYIFFALFAVVAAVILTIDFPSKEKIIEPPLAKMPTESLDTAPKKEEPVPAATTNPAPVATTTPAVTTATNENCPAPDANQTTYRSPSPTKAGNMVYISSRIKQVVCVKDGTGKLEKRALDVNGSHSFFGKAPFVLMTTNLSQADIFFQGYRVRIDDPNASSVILEEVPY